MARAVIRVGVDWPVDDLATVDEAARKVNLSRAAFIRGAANGVAKRTLTPKKKIGDDLYPEVETPVFAREQAD